MAPPAPARLSLWSVLSLVLLLVGCADGPGVEPVSPLEDVD